MTKKIFVTREIPQLGIKMLEEKGYEVRVNESDSIPTKGDLISLLKDKSYDAVLTLLTDPIDAEVYDASPSVKLYANYATGYDNIDVALARERGITVTNAPSIESAEAVAEHTIALMLALSARIVEADEFVRHGKYKGWSPMNFIGMDIFGKTLGLIGAGRIGERVAHYAKGLGMKIIYYDVTRNERIENERGAIYYNNIEDVLRQSDIVSLHVPLLPSTKHLMDDNKFKLMKRASFIINTSRGPVISEESLLKTLNEKTISGAALDVFEFEPQINPELLKLQNIILTPHIASASIEARDAMAKTVALNIIDFFEGRIPKNIVNS